MPEEQPTTDPRLEPTVEVPELKIDVDSVASLGEALGLEAEDIKTVGAEMKEQLKDPEGGERGTGANSSFGIDPRQETLHQMSIDHSTGMDVMNKFTENVYTSILSLQQITQAITAQFADQDALNGASLSDIQAIIDDQQQETSPEA